MQLYVVRHGIAEAGDGMPDAARALTRKGRRRFRKTARVFGGLVRELDLIFTSSLGRSVRTAEILAAVTKDDEVAVLEELNPRYDAAQLRAALAKNARGLEAVALVGHEPQLSAFLAALSGVAQETIDLKKGAIVCVEVRTLAGSKRADARWWLKPRGAERIKGLPLRKQAGAEDERDAAAKARPDRPPRKRKAARQRSHKRAATPLALNPPDVPISIAPAPRS